MKSVDLVRFMEKAGWTFRLNECDDTLEVNGKPLTDAVAASIRVKLRDSNLGHQLRAAEDAMWDAALKNQYHPVKKYLDGLQWDGVWHISALADCFTDANGVFGPYLRHWLIGAVARVYTGIHNYVLVLDGKQGIGKSRFASWLCPLPSFFTDAPLLPDDKDSSMLALRSWIWELSELGAITKRADIEALKGFLSREIFRFRPAFNRYEVNKPGLASFIGTANDAAGLFGDSTGSRRFLATTITAIDWQAYSKLNITQVWAEAADAFRSGEQWRLNADEAQDAETINGQYQFADPVEALFWKSFPLSDPQDQTLWTASADLLQALQVAGMGQNATANMMKIATTLKRLGFDKSQRHNIKGYLGVG